MTAATAFASPPQLSASVTVGSDYLFRGVSQSEGNPVLQASVGFDDESGWFGGLFATTVEFPDRRSRSDDRRAELDLYLGYGFDLGHGWSLVGSVVHYLYPGSGGDYVYTEYGAGIEYRRVRATFALADPALGFGGQGRIWELTTRQPLRHGFLVRAGVGRYELLRAERAYAYWNLGLGRAFGRLEADLGYYDADREGEALWPGRAGGRWVGSLTYALR